MRVRKRVVQSLFLSVPGKIFQVSTLLLFISFTDIAQEVASPIPPWSGFGVEVNAVAGKVYKHEAKFTLPIPSLSTGLDINLLLHTYGQKEWEQRRSYPTIGIGLSYINYGLASIYGSGFSLYPNITVPIIKGRKLEWSARIGDGIGYLTKDYSRQKPVDTINVAIGSHINDFFIFMTDIRYHINDHWDIQAGGNFIHFSDASYSKPNLGINMYGMHIGVIYSPVTSRPAHIMRKLSPLKNRWLFEVRGTMALESAFVSNGPRYPTYLASAYMSKRWISKNKAFAGVDYSYHESIYAYLRNNGIDPGHETGNAYKSAIFAGNEFLLGKVGVVLQLGYYLVQSAEPLGSFYEKIGGNFYFIQKEKGPIKEFFLCAFVKTHGFDAELGETGLGLGF